MAAAVTGWVTAGVLAVGGTLVVAAAATSGPTWASDGATARAAPVPASRPAVGSSVAAGERVAPSPGRPARPFEAPPHDYGPGHRGVDLPSTPGATVVSPAEGVVTFAGPVAGRGVVVVEHADATLTSLEPVTALVAVGDRVAAGRPVAVVQDGPRHDGCPVGAGPACLHWGVRVQGRYVDPWWWLGRSGPVRLLPLGGGP